MDRITTAQDLPDLLARLRARVALQEPPVTSPDAATCQRCEGAGVYATEDGRVFQCDCRLGPAIVTADGVPYEFREVTLDGYEARPGQQTAIRAATGLLSDLYLHGGVGAGKTRLAAAIANTWASQRQTAYFARVPMLLYQLQPDRSEEDVAALERRILTASLVVLDDIGAERDAATDYTRRTLLMLYEGRCDAGLRTVFTSNKSLAELSAQQDDDRLSSRLSGRCVVVQMKTPDQRLVRRSK
jgi:DNA replication protein DnaC